MSWSFRRTSGPAPSSLAGRLRTNLETAQRANEADLLATARRLVHQRTKRTLGSLDVVMDGPLKGHIVGRFGAVWEEKRGGEHAFADRALDEAGPRMRSRVQEGIEAAKHG